MCALLALVVGIIPSNADPGVTASAPRPTLGTLDRDAVLIGAATAGQPGEAWAYRVLPTDQPPPSSPPQTAQFAPSAGSPFGQLVFLRYTDATGTWGVYETPQQPGGQPYRGFAPNALSARMTPHGGGVLLGSDPTQPSGQQVVLLGRDPGGRFTVLPQPAASVLHPASPGVPAEVLATSSGSGRVADAAVENASRTELFFGILGPTREEAVAHWDGSQWTREPIVVPANSSASLKILAIDATAPDNAWLLAQEDIAAGSGVALYHRVQGASGPEWDRANLPATPFDAASTPTQGIANVAAQTGQAQPLTVGTSTVWVDLGFTDSAGGGHGPGGNQFDATVGYDLAAHTASTLCDAKSSGGQAVCDRPLGIQFDSTHGYRSFVFDAGGGGLGTRIITDVLPPDAASGAINDGSYLRIDGTTATLMAGATPSLGGGGAFSSPNAGWLPGPVHLTTQAAPQALSSWPLQARSPLTGIAQAPASAPGALTGQVIAVGTHGVVERFTPGQGWQREFLLTANGSVSSPNLRAVAWPSAGRAFAVGDLGAMWIWQSATDLWEPDPAAPLDGFQGNLLGIAFSPSNPALGYAVGTQGTLLRYDKTWTQETLPADVAGNNLTSVAFSGGQALVAAGSNVLENNGSGWTVDQGVRTLLASLPNKPSILTVAGLPDGGAIAAGHDVVLERDSLSSPWRVSDQPLPGDTVVAAAAVRAGARVQAIVSVQPQVQYPPALPTIITDPNSPPPLLPPNPLPASGYLMRESANGWVDDEQTSYASPTEDKPVKTDPIAAFDLGTDGSGWVVGGWSGQADESGRGSSASGSGGQEVRDRVSTSGIYRYQPSGGSAPAPIGAAAAPVAFPTSQVNFLVAGNAACAESCADLRDEQLAPDQNLTRMMSVASNLINQPGGPRALLYTGGRLESGTLGSADASRFAQLLETQPGVPVYSAVSADASGAGNVSAFSDAFTGFPAPFGTGPLPTGVSTGSIPAGASATSGVRTHYAFDSAGPAGTVRVVVIDNSRGSLAASDPYQNPAEPQAAWLKSVLADAKQRGLAAIVVGNRDLNSKLAPQINVATDGDQEASILTQGGASAYLYDRPEEQRTSRVPAGAAATIPEYGTGTLGYRSPLQQTTQPGQPDSLFGQTGYLIVSVDTQHRNADTNVAPVTASLQPLLQDISLQALDGTLLRRSHPALFQALGRRPVSGDRWGPTSAGDATPNPPGADPYTTFPPDPCLQANCSSFVAPHYTFASSRRDIANFVEQDPNSQDLRKPLQGANGKAIPTATSGLLCAFNPGTTTVSVTAGGLTASVPVTVLGGSVEQPCGTVPLINQPTQPTNPGITPPPPITITPRFIPPPPPPPAPVTPPPPAAAPVIKAVPVKATPSPPKVFVPLPPLIPGIPPASLAVSNGVLTPPPPPAGAFARPIPPGGAVARVYEEKREEEAAPEQSQAFSAYHPDQGPDVPLAPFVLGAVLLSAAAGASIRTGMRRRDRRHEAAIAAARIPSSRQSQQRRYR